MKKPEFEDSGIYNKLLHTYHLTEYGIKFSVCEKCGWKNKTKMKDNMLMHHFLYHWFSHNSEEKMLNQQEQMDKCLKYYCDIYIAYGLVPLGTTLDNMIEDYANKNNIIIPKNPSERVSNAVMSAKYVKISY